MQIPATPKMLEALTRMLTTDSANDKKWFLSNPNATLRIRDCTDDELSSGGMTRSEKFETHVLKLTNGSLVHIVVEKT